MAERNDQGSQPAPTTPPSSTPIQSHGSAATDAAAVSAPAASDVTAPVAQDKPPASLERLDLVLLALLLVLTFLVGSFAATNSDVWLHMASGQRIAAGDWTIGVDPFSFATEATPTRPAVPWVQHSWFYSLLFYLLYNLVGGGGLVLLKALGVVALAWCLLQIPGGKNNRFLAVIYVGLAVLAISPQLILRPMTLSFLLFGITLLICHRAGALGYGAANPRLLWRLPLLFLLWANLDAWFIMGPLTLALLWAGNGLGNLLGIPSSFPGKTLGAVLGVGLLACVINPHHVQVFMLPPELANLLVRVVDVPDFLGAGGRALRNLQLADPDSYGLPSPLSLAYWRREPPFGGASVGGLAYVPLLVLGLISFLINAAVTKKPGAPGLHPGRFLLWVFLAFLSVLQARLIPWFAIASAPIAVLNVVDWRTWLTNIQVPNWRPALLGRALTVFLLFLLLFLAWPGWLYSPPLNDFGSTRRVAWKMPVDPSYHGAALYLAAMKKGHSEVRVFNLSPELAHYCAWYAPGVKCFIDTRWSLFPDEIAQTAKTRKGLAVNEPEAWQKTFADRKVDYLSLSNFQNKRDGELAAQLWKDESRWLQKYGDGKTLVFAWSGPGTTFEGAFRADIAQRAFGKVPENERAPAKTVPWPQEEPSFWSLYWQGLPPLPLSAQESNMWWRYHLTMGIAWQAKYNFASGVTRWADAAGLGFGSIMLPYEVCAVINNIPAKFYFHRPWRNNKIVLKARDFGPPAAPVLMIRRARRGIVDNPNLPRVYLLLADALQELVNNQEDHWANYQGDPQLMGGMRTLVRQIQIRTALATYLDLRPEDPEIHEQIANMFLRLNFLDVALPHLQQAIVYFDQYRPDTGNPQAVKFFKEKKQKLEKETQTLENEVKKRRDQYGLEATSKKSLERYGVAMKYGLAQEAVSVLQKIKVESLTPVENEGRDFLLSQLVLLLGRANVLNDKLTTAGPAFTELRIFHAAAVGNYADVDKLLADLAKSRERAGEQWLATTMAAVIALAPSALEQPRLASCLFGVKLPQWFVDNRARPLAELLTLHGIMALEYGDTAAAQKHLAAALALAGPATFFQDRPIAERCLELLQEANK